MCYQYPDYRLCPDSIRECLDEWASSARHTPGGFVQAVLDNNLVMAFALADHNNTKAMPHIAAYLYSKMPSASFGSPEKCDAWAKFKQQEREVG